MSIKAIITGSTGMVGEGVLHECLQHPEVESVLVINRKPCGVNHSKLKEIIHVDFSEFSTIESELSGYNAAFLCMGVSSMGLKEATYTKFTYDMTMALAKPLERLNPDMIVCYVSGQGTDTSETGRMMWARVKGKTENDLMKMAFKRAYLFRPAAIQPTPGLKNSYAFYKILNPLIPFLRKLFPQYFTTLKEIGLAMIQVVKDGYSQQIIEVKDIVSLASQHLSEGENR